jgi:hypothetical protein
MKALPCAVVRAAVAAGAAARDEAPEPAVQRHVAEDDHVRIDELKVRGRTERVVVQPKWQGAKLPEYQILPPNPAQDPSRPGGAGGQRVWSLRLF